jgi:chromosome partitioning protein
MKYLVTRFEPGDGPQNQMVAFLRSIFGEHVLIHPMLKSTAISDAGLTNQTIFEVGRQQFTRATYDRAVESVVNVTTEIEGQICKAWGRVS